MSPQILCLLSFAYSRTSRNSAWGCGYVPNVSIISACSMHDLCDFAMFCLNFHTLLTPFGLYLVPAEETPNIDLLFPFSSLYRRRRRFKIGAARRSCPGTLPEGGTPFGRPSIAMDASRMCRE